MNNEKESAWGVVWDLTRGEPSGADAVIRRIHFWGMPTTRRLDLLAPHEHSRYLHHVVTRYMRGE